LGVRQQEPSESELKEFVHNIDVAHTGVWVSRKVRSGLGRLQGKTKKLFARIESVPDGTTALIFWGSEDCLEQERLNPTYKEGKYFWDLNELTSVKVVQRLPGSVQIVGKRASENAILDFDERAGHSASLYASEFTSSMNQVLMD